MKSAFNYLIIFALLIPCSGHAGQGIGAIKGLQILLQPPQSTIINQQSSVPARHASPPEADEAGEPNPQSPPASPCEAWRAGAIPAPSEVEGRNPQSGSCPLGAMYPVKICDPGSGLLCVSTPDLSVAGEVVNISGTLDTSATPRLEILVQHEYSRETRGGLVKDLKTDEVGRFTIPVTLWDLGPYTIAVRATSVKGTTEEIIRTSRVTAPSLKLEDITLDPNPNEGPVVGSINLSISPLQSCQFCDFIGLSTSGATLKVKNVITSDVGVKVVSRLTNVASSGAMSVCVPVSDGRNHLTVELCNAAECPQVTGIEFDGVSADKKEFSWVRPIKSIYQSTEGVELVFNVSETETCDAKLEFNRDEPKDLCPIAAGEHKIKLKPESGINIGAIRFNDRQYPFTFGWGRVVSPAEDLRVDRAGAFSISKSFLTDLVRKFVNNFFESDQFQSLLSTAAWTSFGEGAPRLDIPGCKTDSASTRTVVEFSSPPKIGHIEIPAVGFDQDKITLTVDIEDLATSLRVFTDENKDGLPDKRFLPLKLIFKKMFLPVEIRVDRSHERPLFLLTSPFNNGRYESTDCDYKREHACTNRPAIVVPKHFVGGATRFGGFVICDESVEPDCKGINRETARLNEIVLDQINEKLYCDGSTLLTRALGEWLTEVPIEIGCPKASMDGRPALAGEIAPTKVGHPAFKVGGCEFPFANRGWELSVGIDLLGPQFKVDKNGIWGEVPAIIGGIDFKDPLTGFLMDEPAKSNIHSLAREHDLGLSISEGFFNAILFALSQGGDRAPPLQDPRGLLDWDISEVFFNKAGFDFVKECDEFKSTEENMKPSALCYIRPRVGELLGPTLTTYGYFSPADPIMMRIRGDPFLSPHLKFFKRDGRQYIDIQAGNLQISFYAIELDSDGNPVILSLNPMDPDPLAGPIISFKASFLIAFELSEIETNPEDPSTYLITLRPDADLSKLVLTPIPGGNLTVVDDESMFGVFEEKLRYAINIYSAPEKAFKIKIPKRLGDLFMIEKDGLKVNVENSQEYIDMMAKILLSFQLSDSLQ